MSKRLVPIIAIFVFVFCTLAGLAFLRFSPKGSLNPSTPEDAVSSYLTETDPAEFRDLYITLASPDVTEFENRTEVSAAVYDEITGEFSFREDPDESSANEQDYIISRGNNDLFVAHCTYSDGTWSVSSMECTGTISPVSRTLTITVPTGSSVQLNGINVSESYITDSSAGYPQMSELEAQFPNHPDRCTYSVPGIYLSADISVSGTDDPVLLSSDGTDWSYITSDSGTHALYITAPEDSVVSIDGTALSPSQAVGSSYPSTSVELTDELQAYLPTDYVYSFGNLYGTYEVTCELNGKSLPCESDGTYFEFSSSDNSETADSEINDRVCAFLQAICRYGAGQGFPSGYACDNSPASKFLQDAMNSVIWINYNQLTFNNVTMYDYVPLGEDAFLCKGNVLCNNTTLFNSWDLDLDYEMLWVRSGVQWCIYDFVYL